MSHELDSTEGATEVPEAGAEEPERHHGANGTSPPEPPRRGPGRPKGAKNRATHDGRMFYGRHARKLVPKLIKRAIEEAEKPRGDLDFAERIGKLAAAYAFGRPVDRQEVSGPDGTPITTEALLPMEAMQRLGGLLAAHQAQQPTDGPPVIDIEPEPVAGPENREEAPGGPSTASTAGRADD